MFCDCGAPASDVIAMADGSPSENQIGVRQSSQTSCDAVDELLFGASAMIQSAVIAALDHYEGMEEPRQSRMSAQPRRRTCHSASHSRNPLAGSRERSYCDVRW